MAQWLLLLVLYCIQVYLFMIKRSESRMRAAIKFFLSVAKGSSVLVLYVASEIETVSHATFGSFKSQAMPGLSSQVMIWRPKDPESPTLVPLHLEATYA